MLGRLFVLASLTALTGGLSASAFAQELSAPCQLCSAPSQLISSAPAPTLTLSVETRLDFDRLVLDGLGEGVADLAPGGERDAHGSVSVISARATVGHIVIRGEAGRYIRVTLPANITLFGLSGGSIQLNSIRSDSGDSPRIGSDGTLSIRLGGSLRIVGEIDGDYRGEVPIDVDYL